MIKLLTVLLILVAGQLVIAADERVTLDECKWIWHPTPDAEQVPEETRYFRKVFELPAVPSQARLVIAADNEFAVWINGHEIGAGKGWDKLHSYNVTPRLSAGKNVLAIKGVNASGPAGIVCKLVVPGSQAIVSDASWKSSTSEKAGWTNADFVDSDWTAVQVVAHMGNAPWGLLTMTGDIPDSFPRFVVPGHEKEMASLRELFYLHYKGNGPMATLWDEWLPQATLWPAVKSGGDMSDMRRRWAAALSGRRIDGEGYVSTHQHDGLGHAEGWPFPHWQQGKGMGWQFASTGIHGYDAALVKPDGFAIARGKGGAIGPNGWEVELAEAGATLQTPATNLEVPIHAPFVRLNWRATGLDRSNPYLEWTTKEQPEFSSERRMYFSPATQANAETRTMIPVYKHPQWKGVVTSMRIGFDNPAGAKVTIKSLHTAYDSRHNINNSNFIGGCCDYFAWTDDKEFLRSQIVRMRTAMRFMMSEFQTRERKCIYTTWIGHEGTSGISYSADGNKHILRGRGVGNNYWDLLPCGGEDTLATIYYYDTLKKLADMEQMIRANPQWNVPVGADAFDPADLRQHAEEVKAYSQKRFWNESTGRFVCAVDLEGNAHDYGFTFVNCEAVHFGLASDEQAKAILAWLSGSRTVDGDTSSGADIYHFRFGPRATTKRNIEYYFWGWSGPESIPFGGQVQDGGAVLGWSYYDLSARLKTNGPDDAWKRLSEIIPWFDEVQKEGGYREYYKVPARGTMQGGGSAGGLGLDKEFFESVLVPQIMLYGFMGFRPTAGGFAIDPKLPKDFPELGITRIHLHDLVLEITVSEKKISIRGDEKSEGEIEVKLPAGWKSSGKVLIRPSQVTEIVRD